eukprot:scaffold89608_cov36-Phaeocystis_antarctica.AAC.1
MRLSWRVARRANGGSRLPHLGDAAIAVGDGDAVLKFPQEGCAHAHRQARATANTGGVGHTATPSATPLVPHVSGVSLGVFSRASFAIQSRPRLRTRLDGAGPQAPGTPNFAECGATKSSARPGHPCDETAVAVLLGTPKLSPPPCFLARDIFAPTAP